MKIKPILFSTPMVQAIKEGRKFCTRRLVKYNKEIAEATVGFSMFTEANQFSVRGVHANGQYGESFFDLPYSKGDILWVRESFYEPMFEELNGKYYYKADLAKQGWDFKWKPSLFMPKEACRLFLQIKSIEAERLQDITESDAIREGIERTVSIYPSPADPRYIYPDFTNECDGCESARVSFATLWKKINGPESWDANPWVWVIRFKQVEKPSNFLTQK